MVLVLQRWCRSPTAHIEIHIKNAIRGLQQKLAEQATDRKTISSLLAPIYDLALTAKTAGIWAHALIVFRSPGLFQYYLLHGQFKEAQTVDNRFHVRPLLRTLAHETRFHLLGLSQRACATVALHTAPGRTGCRRVRFPPSWRPG